jgi:hypothetical protein
MAHFIKIGDLVINEDQIISIDSDDTGTDITTTEWMQNKGCNWLIELKGAEAAAVREYFEQTATDLLRWKTQRDEGEHLRDNEPMPVSDNPSHSDWRSSR